MVINAAIYCMCVVLGNNGEMSNMEYVLLFCSKGNTLEEIPNFFLRANISPRSS